MTGLIAAAAGLCCCIFWCPAPGRGTRRPGRSARDPTWVCSRWRRSGLLTWLGFGYAAARGAAGDQLFWSVTPATQDVQLALQFVAMLLVVPGLATPNPTSVHQEAALDKPDVVRGMLRITPPSVFVGRGRLGDWPSAGERRPRQPHPVRILVDPRPVRNRQHRCEAQARARARPGIAFAARTSNVPFAAILGGRQSLKRRPGEIGWWRLALAVAIYAGLLFGHRYAFGVSALPDPALQ